MKFLVLVAWWAVLLTIDVYHDGPAAQDPMFVLRINPDGTVCRLMGQAPVASCPLNP